MRFLKTLSVRERGVLKYDGSVFRFFGQHNNRSNQGGYSTQYILYHYNSALFPHSICALHVLFKINKGYFVNSHNEFVFLSETDCFLWRRNKIPKRYLEVHLCFHYFILMHAISHYRCFTLVYLRDQNSLFSAHGRRTTEK